MALQQNELKCVRQQKLHIKESTSLCVVSAVSGGGPSGVHVSEETPVSLRVSWMPPNAHVLNYRVSYTELSESERQDRTVSQQEVGLPSGRAALASNRDFKSVMLVSAGVCSGR